jgi:hypothetical protein
MANKTEKLRRQLSTVQTKTQKKMSDMMTSTTITLNELSDDEIAEIFSFCTVQDNVQLDLVNFRFHSIASSNRIWKLYSPIGNEEVTVDIFNPPTPTTPLPLLSAAYSFTTSSNVPPAVAPQLKQEYIQNRKLIQFPLDIQLALQQRETVLSKSQRRQLVYLVLLVFWLASAAAFILVSSLFADGLILQNEDEDEEVEGKSWKWLVMFALFCVMSVFHVGTVCSFLFCRATGLLPDGITEKLLFYLWSKYGVQGRPFRLFFRYLYNDTVQCVEMLAKLEIEEDQPTMRNHYVFLNTFYMIFHTLWLPFSGIAAGILYTIVPVSIYRLSLYLSIPVYLWWMLSSLSTAIKAVELTSSKLAIEDYVDHFDLEYDRRKAFKIDNHKYFMRSIPITCFMFYLFLAPSTLLVLLKLNEYVNGEYTFLLIPLLVGLTVIVLYLSIGQLKGLITKDAYEDVFGTYSPMTSSLKEFGKHIIYGGILLILFFMGLVVFALVYSPILSFLSLIIVESYTQVFNLFIICVPLLACIGLCIMALLSLILFAVIMVKYARNFTGEDDDY